MESERSLPHLQDPSTCPNSEPVQSSPLFLIQLLEGTFNVILPSTPWSSKWFVTSSPHQNPVCASRVFHTCHMPRPSRCSRSYHPHSIWWGVQINARVSPIRCSTLNVSLIRRNSFDWLSWNKFKLAAVARVKIVIKQFSWRERQMQQKSHWEWLVIGPGFESDAGLGLSWIASCI